MSDGFFVRAFRSLQRRSGQLLFSLNKKKSHFLYGKNIFLVYTMGKVGTSTISTFFKKKHPEIISFHLHYLSDYWIREKLPSLDPIYHHQIKVAENALRTIAELPDHRLKIITMVREPLEREVSMIFENGRGMFNVNSINDLSADFLFNYLDQNTDENVLSWFDTEFKAFTGFDIYSVPFDKERGYTIYHTEKADILCMTTEKMNNCIQQAMMEFTGMRIGIPAPANRSDEKEGKELYKIIKREYKPPVKKLELLYNSKFINHFYSEDDVDAFKNKWSRKLTKSNNEK